LLVCSTIASIHANGCINNMAARPRGRATRQAILESACDVFARKSYRDATVAEICKGASANIAALNYHFGGKAAAYREVWRFAFAEGIAAHPLEHSSASAHASPVERLRSHVTSLLRRMNQDGQSTRFERMRIWEITLPSGEVEDVDRGVREASRDHMLTCLRELIGVKVDNEVLLWCEASILSQCRMVLPFNRRDITLLSSQKIDSAMIRTLADHIVRFSVAGVRTYSHSNDRASRAGRPVRRKRRSRTGG